MARVILFRVDVVVMFALATLPVIIVNMYAFGGRKHLTKCLMVAGGLFLFHLGHTAAWIWYMTRPAADGFFCFHPWGSILKFTLNWVVPSNALGLLLGGVLMGRSRLRSRGFIVGTVLFVTAAIGYVGLSWYIVERWDISMDVWWMF
jgi:hypothetical protein